MGHPHALCSSRDTSTHYRMLSEEPKWRNEDVDCDVKSALVLFSTREALNIPESPCIGVWANSPSLSQWITSTDASFSEYGLSKSHRDNMEKVDPNVAAGMGENSNEDKFVASVGEEDHLDTDEPLTKKTKPNGNDSDSDVEILEKGNASDLEILPEDENNQVIGNKRKNEEVKVDLNEEQAEEISSFVEFLEKPKIDVNSIKRSYDIKNKLVLWLTRDPAVRIVTYRARVEVMYPKRYSHHDTYIDVDTDDDCYMNLTAMNKTGVSVVIRFFEFRPGHKCIFEKSLFPMTCSCLLYKADRTKPMKKWVLDVGRFGVKLYEFNAPNGELIEEDVGGDTEIGEDGGLVEWKTGSVKLLIKESERGELAKEQPNEKADGGEMESREKHKAIAEEEEDTVVIDSDADTVVIDSDADTVVIDSDADAVVLESDSETDDVIVVD